MVGQILFPCIITTICEADMCYDEILKRNPNHVDALDGKGVVLGLKGNFPKAISYFDKALEIDPKNSHVLRNKASALEQLGNKISAEEFYRKADNFELGQQRINRVKGFASIILLN